jgi:hypothetical protein
MAYNSSEISSEAAELVDTPSARQALSNFALGHSPRIKQAAGSGAVADLSTVEMGTFRVAAGTDSGDQHLTTEQLMEILKKLEELQKGMERIWG